MNNVLKVFVITALVVLPFAGFAADGAEALQRYHEANKQRFHESEARLRNEAAVEKNKSDIPQEERKSSAQAKEANARS
jgi:hypothetical protein